MPLEVLSFGKTLANLEIIYAADPHLEGMAKIVYLRWLAFDIFNFIKSILKSLIILAMWLVPSSAIYSQIAPSFALNRIFISANENGSVKQNSQSDFKAFFNQPITLQENERRKVTVWQISKWISQSELQVVQFWSEVILVMLNRTHAARSFDFEITRMIWDQIELLSLQLPW